MYGCNYRYALFVGFQFPLDNLDEIPEDLTSDEDIWEFQHTYLVPRENLTQENVTTLHMTIVLTGIMICIGAIRLVDRHSLCAVPSQDVLRT